MKLRGRIFLALTVLALLGALPVAAVLRNTMMKEILAHEYQDHLKNVHRVLRAINENKELSDITNYTLTSRLLSAEEKLITKPIGISPLSDDLIEGKTFVKDSLGEALFEISVRAPRSIYKQGQQNMALVIKRAITLYFAVLLIALLLVNFLFINRVLKINNAIVANRKQMTVESIAALKNFDQDELGALAAKIFDLYTQVRDLADNDELTGIFNVRFFRIIYNNQFKLAQRHGRPLSVILFDLDHLKSINDNYGHLQGDKVLKEVGAALKSLVRTTDVAARYGGEEFIVLLNETDAKGAAVVAEKIRMAVEGLEIPNVNTVGSAIKVTISLGIAEINTASEQPEESIASADKALYKAKKAGRNRFAIYGNA